MSVKVKSSSGSRWLGEKSRAFLSATVLLTALACTSEESLTEPSIAAGVTAEMRVAKTYTALDLDTPFGSGEATAINPAGVVVGNVGDAFIWEKGVLLTDELATVGFFRAFDINPAGQVVGAGFLPGADGFHALLWEKGVVTDLGTLGGVLSEATAINPKGQVVGWSFTSDWSTHAFLWEKGVVRDLGTLGGATSSALGINPKGQVVGYSTTATGLTHAFLWENGVMQDLGTLGGGFSLAEDINASGQVVGLSYIAGGGATTHAFIWEKGVMTDLGTPGGEFVNSGANAINAAGQVVGTVASEGFAVFRPVIWDKGVITELATLSGGGFGQALDINPAGQVVGMSTGQFSLQVPTLWTRK
jgi:probable HAF family extracellular repeat protein